MSKSPQKMMFADDDENKKEPSQQKKEKVDQEEPKVPSDVMNIVDLPSKGQLGYPSSVDFREVLVRDEEILSTATNDTYARTLNRVLKSVLNDCEFYEKLCIFDRDFLLVWIWANNYNPTKTVTVTCPHCGTDSDHVVDFTKHEISDIHPKFKGTYEMSLKNFEHPVKIRLNTVADEIATEEYLSKNKDARYDHVMVVSSIDFGVPMPLHKKIQVAGDKITSAEFNKIKQFHIKLRYGIEPNVEYKCKNTECGKVSVRPFPFHTEDILFPTVSADIEEFL